MSSKLRPGGETTPGRTYYLKRPAAPAPNWPEPLMRTWRTIQAAVATHGTIMFRYRSASGTSLEWKVLKPAQVCQTSKGAWLVRGYDLKKRAIRQFAIGYMVSVSGRMGSYKGKLEVRGQKEEGSEAANSFYGDTAKPMVGAPIIGRSKGHARPATGAVETAREERTEVDCEAHMSNNHAGEHGNSPAPSVAAGPADGRPQAREAEMGAARAASRPAAVKARGPLPKHLAAGAQRRALVLRVRALAGAIGRQGNPPLEMCTEAGAPAGVAGITLYNWCKKWRHLSDAELTAEACATRQPTGRPRATAVTAADVQAIRAANTIINRTEDSGSSQEAARLALRTGQLTPAAAAEIAARAELGQPLLTPAVRRDVAVPARVVRAYRNPSEARLRYVWSPGSLKMLEGDVDHEFARAGDILEMDDGSKNFYCCVPWDRAGIPEQPCADKFGVIVGRFQLLLAVDVGEYFIPGYGHTARPRDSYRAEDVLSTLKTLFETHGVWREARFERGTWESDAVQAALAGVGCNLHTVFTPRAKAFVEGMFNILWTKTSHLPGQVGRFRGETEEEYQLLMQCRRGTVDPHEVFPMLRDTLGAVDTAITERNATWVNSATYGKWVPEQRFELRRTMGSFSPWDATQSYLFSPRTELRKIVRGHVTASVPFAEGVSVRYEWGDPEMGNHDGEDVRIYFDPFGPDPSATVVLLDKQGVPREVLCRAEQMSKVARYARKAFHYADDADTGLAALKRDAQALRRDVRTFLPGGKPGVQRVEIRSGDGAVLQQVSNAPAEAPAAKPQPARGRDEMPQPLRDRAELSRDFEEAARFEKENQHLFV